VIRLARRPPRLPVPAPRGAVVARLVDAAARRGARTVLREVTLDVRAGEVLGVVGPNGAGKSTLLGLLAGDLTASSGTVEVDGAPLERWSAAELGMRRAVLLQANAVAFPFPVAEVVRMGRAPWQGTPGELADDAAVDAALVTTELTDLADRPLPQLSGGEQARAALARALAQDTGLVLLDEPTAALDLHHAEAALLHVRALADAGRAVVVVLHDLDLAGAHADRVALVGDGQLVACGPPSQVLTEDLLSSTYGADVEVLRHPRTGAPMVLPRR
jgi:iron complex transport system ATP-binding protein